MKTQSCLLLLPFTVDFYLKVSLLRLLPLLGCLHPLPLCVRAKLLQLCPTLQDPVDSSPPGYSVHGILQAIILEWVAILFSMGSSLPRDQTPVSLHCRQILHHLSHQILLSLVKQMHR